MVRVAVGVDEMTTITSLLVPEHAAGSTTPPISGLSYAITLT